LSQRQRVALARALAINPRILLLDEPFGALDALVRKDLRRWLKRIHHETGVTTIFVTHDQEEALDLADRVVVLKSGKVEQIGTPLEIHSTPKSAFVFDFLGAANKANGRISNGIAHFDGFSAPVAGAANDGDYTVRFRPYEAVLSREGAGIPVTVSAVLPAGHSLRLELKGPDGALFETQHPHGTEADQFTVGDALKLRPERVYAYA
jgi:sulfate transport system ATP-binding protein